jgi:hypothetical protein
MSSSKQQKSVTMNIPEPATFADDLDGFGASLFLVDKTSRRIVHANARAMLRERSVLREGAGWLRVGGDENTKGSRVRRRIPKALSPFA